jgi:uncharacterized protein (DUF488 family)
VDHFVPKRLFSDRKAGKLEGFFSYIGVAYIAMSLYNDIRVFGLKSEYLCPNWQVKSDGLDG